VLGGQEVKHIGWLDTGGRASSLSQVQATRVRRGKRKRTTAVEMAVQAAAVMTAAMAVRAVQDRTRRLAEAGRRWF
jgi:hypothetical protein